MHTMTMEFEGATREGTSKIKQTLSEANITTQRLLDRAVCSNNEKLRFLLLRDGQWFTQNWKRMQRRLHKESSYIAERLLKMGFGIFLYGLLAPIMVLETARFFKLSFLSPLFHFGTIPFLVAAATFYLTSTFYKWRAFRDHHEKFGVSLTFLQQVPAGHMHRGWAVTDQALYMMVADNDGAKAEVKRVPWSSVSSSLYAKEEGYEGIRVFDKQGECMQGISFPQEMRGVPMAEVANKMRSLVAERAIPYQ